MWNISQDWTEVNLEAGFYENISIKNIIVFFFLKGHGNKRDKGLFFMISSNLKYYKQINPGDKEIFIGLRRLSKCLVNILTHQMVEIRRQRSGLWKH